MDAVQAEPTKRCPLCGEQILAIAIKCKHCGSMLTEVRAGVSASVTAPPAPQPQVTEEPAIIPAPVEPLGPVAIWAGARWFALGALPGLFLFGLLFIAGLFRYRGGISSLPFELAAEKMVVLMPILLLVLGIPAGLLFSLGMRRDNSVDPWQNALTNGAVLTALLTIAFGFLLEVMAGSKIDDYTWLVINGGITGFGGAVLANLYGRRSEPLPVPAAVDEKERAE